MMRRVIVLFTIVLFCGCSSSDVYLGLEDKGVLPLSGTDAFLGSNVFLAREMEQDPLLHNFIRTRGGPDAIEIDTADDAQMRLYYGREHSVYIAHPIQRKTRRQWVVRGPYQIEWKDAKKLQSLLRKASGDRPVFFMEGNYRRYPDEPEEPQQIVRVLIPPTPKPTPAPRRPVRRAPVIKKGPETAPSPQIPELNPNDFQKLNTDQRAILIAQGYAPRAENGDVVHTVKYENETLAQISRWYTEAEKNKGEIAALNGLGADAALVKGQQVRVPLKLVQRMKVMPADFK